MQSKSFLIIFDEKVFFNFDYFEIHNLFQEYNDSKIIFSIKTKFIVKYLGTVVYGRYSHNCC